jgi:hypothetical protein
VVQLVAHQILDLGVLGSSPSAAALLKPRSEENKEAGRHFRWL